MEETERQALCPSRWVNLAEFRVAEEMSNQLRRCTEDSALKKALSSNGLEAA